MASGEEYMIYVLDLLSGLDDITYRPMMGEYVIYYRGKVFGGVYDDRFLVKPTKSVLEMMPDAVFEIPYDGGREMVLVDTEDRDFIRQLVEAMYDDLPAPKQKIKKKK